MMYRIYALCYPTGEPFYIGQTSRNRRFTEHLSLAKRNDPAPRYAIIRELLDAGTMPVYKILDTADDSATALNIEARLIAKYGIDNLSNALERQITSRGGQSHRFQCFLDKEPFKRLDALAKSSGLSIAEHIRRAIDLYLK